MAMKLYTPHLQPFHSYSKSKPPPPHLSSLYIRNDESSYPLGFPEQKLMAIELVPSSLASIVPILRVANEVEKENPRVAYLCRFLALVRTQRMYPTTSGPGICQFKTHLLHRLEMEEEKTKHKLASTDPKEIKIYYQMFYEKNIREGQYTKQPKEMARIYQIATILYDVLRIVVLPSKVDDQIKRYAKDVEEKKKQYNSIFPSYDDGNKLPAIEERPCTCFCSIF